MLRASLLSMALVTTLAACGQAVNEPTDELSVFALDTLVTGLVAENVMDCIVDGECALRIEFADTTVAALYGAGEIAVPVCPIPTAVSTLGFDVRAGETVDVVVTECDTGGYALQQLVRRD